MEDTKLCIGVAVADTIKYPTVAAIVGTIFQAQYRVHFVMRAGCYVQENRTGIVEEALEKECTHIFFIDADMMFPAETANRLIAHQVPVVGANYNHRYFPRTPTVKMHDGKGNVVGYKVDDLPKDELFQCFAVGTGCCMIQADVFKHIKKPWFTVVQSSEGQLLVTEDVWFARNCFHSGVPVYCDPTIKCGHIGDFAF